MHTLLALALTSSFALAPDDPGMTREPDRVVAAKKSFVDMTEAEVRGIVVRPSGEFLRARTRVKFRNLIELRATFRPELAASVGTLR
ncbi:MAG: hypothetical protein A2138_07970 [Deltaproteobacteria bacterium RBG_16_71_12]|nr:MAG: hypothetical protein A2138_07970 [Deltaproteobacteria bacterium RBG_16_71_12]